MARLRGWLARPDVVALDPEEIARLAAALEERDPPVTSGRAGAVIAYAAGPARRRLLQFDRRGHVIAACRWRPDGGLAWAKCRLPDGRWIGVEPGAATHPPWGPSDQVWLMEPEVPWAPRERRSFARFVICETGITVSSIPCVRKTGAEGTGDRDGESAASPPYSSM